MAKMKYFVGLTLLLVSFFSSGQKVLTTFDKILISESFDEVSDRWEYRTTNKEIFINSSGRYVMKRLSSELFSISLPKETEILSEYEVIYTFKLGPKSKGRKIHQGGLVVCASEDGRNALILEFNTKKQFRVWRLKDGKKSAISESQSANWSKTKLLEKEDNNIVAVKYSRGLLDIYVNKQFLVSIEIPNPIVGRPGFYLGPNSDMSIEMFRWAVNSKMYEQEMKAKEVDIDLIAQGGGFQEMVMIFKNKIETQRSQIEEIEAQLAICQAKKNSDSSAIQEIEELKTKYADSREKSAKLQIEIDDLKKRLSYLEALKEQMEQDPNGDLVLSLTELLAEERNKVNELRRKNALLEEEISELKTD